MDPRQGEIILARLTADGSFVVGKSGEDSNTLFNVYRLKVSEPAPGKVSADFYNLMHPVSGHPANLSFDYILTSVPAPDWIAVKYLELTSGLVVAQEMPKKELMDLVNLGRARMGKVN